MHQFRAELCSSRKKDRNNHAYRKSALTKQQRFDKHKNDYFLTSRNELWFFSKLKFRCKTATEEARCSFVVIRRSAEKKMAAAKIQLDEKRHVNTLPIFKDIQIMHWAFPQRPIRTFRF